MPSLQPASTLAQKFIVVAIGLFLLLSTALAQEARESLHEPTQESSSSSEASKKEEEHRRARFREFFADFGEVGEDYQFSTRDARKVLDDDYLMKWSQSAKGYALLNARIDNAGLRMRCREGGLIWGELVPAMREFDMRFQYRSRGKFTLRVEQLVEVGANQGETADPDVFEIHIKSNAAQLFRLRNGRLKPQTSVEGKSELTGWGSARFQVLEGTLSLELGNEAEAVKLNYDKLKKSLYRISLGARDGNARFKASEMTFQVAKSWWKASGERLLAGRAVRQLQRRGALQLFQSIQHRMLPAGIQKALKDYDESALKLREQGDYEAILDALPDNPLARFERAMHLRALGETDAARKAAGLLLDLDHPGLRSLQIELALRSSREQIIDPRHLPRDSNYDLLRALLQARLGHFDLAIKCLESDGSSVAENLRSSFVALRDGAGLERVAKEGLISVRSDCDEKWMGRVLRHANAWSNFYQASLGTTLKEPVEIWLFSNAQKFVETVFMYAHQRLQLAGALFVCDSKTGARIFLCSEPGDDRALMSLQHELWHAFTATAPTDSSIQLPWVNEGIATLMSSARLLKDKDSATSVVYEFPRRRDWHFDEIIASLRELSKEHKTPLLSLVEIEKFYSPEHANRNYGLAWALSWYGVTKEDPSLLSALRRGDGTSKDLSKRYLTPEMFAKVALALENALKGSDESGSD